MAALSIDHSQSFPYPFNDHFNFVITVGASLAIVCPSLLSTMLAFSSHGVRVVSQCDSHKLLMTLSAGFRPCSTDNNYDFTDFCNEHELLHRLYKLCASFVRLTLSLPSPIKALHFAILV